MFITIKELSGKLNVSSTTIINKAKSLNILHKEGSKYIIKHRDVKVFLKTYYPLRYNLVETFGTSLKQQEAECMFKIPKGKIIKVKNKNNGKEYYYLRKVPISIDPLVYYKGSSFKSKEEAIAKRDELLASIENSKQHYIDNSFNSIARDFILSNDQLRYSTKVFQINTFDLHIAPFFKDLSVSNITRGMVQEFVYKHNHKSKGIRLVLGKILRYLYKTERISKNIWEQIEFPKAPKSKNVKVAMTKEQVQKHLDAVRRKKLYHVVLLLYTTGLRVGEALALQWDDIEILNDSEGYINVDSTITRDPLGFTIGAPKTPESTRKVYFYSSALVSALRAAKENSKGTQWIAENSRGTSRIYYPSFRKLYFNRLQERLGFTDFQFSPHITRRTYISHSLYNGVSTKEIERQVGHTDSTMIIKYYSKSISNAEDEYRGKDLYL